MSFAEKTKEDVLIACGRCCCICHRFCGLKMEVHHIVEEAEGGSNDLDNAIPLCFDCHADMRSYDHRHPKGNKYTRSELRRHRDKWYGLVAGNAGLAATAITIETDKQVYRQMLDVLPWNGSVSFIESNNFAGFSFELSRLDDLYEFEHHSRNPTFEFVDPDLENLRAALTAAIQKFTALIAVETFPTNSSDRNSIPEELESEQPERFHEVVSAIHGTAATIIDIYKSLIRTATRKLGVLPPATSIGYSNIGGVLWKRLSGGRYEDKPRCPNCDNNPTMGEFPPKAHLHWVCSKCNGVFDYVRPPNEE